MGLRFPFPTYNLELTTYNYAGFRVRLRSLQSKADLLRSAADRGGRGVLLAGLMNLQRIANTNAGTPTVGAAV